MGLRTLSPRKPRKESTVGMPRRLDHSRTARCSERLFSRRSTAQEAKHALTSSLLPASRLMRWICLVSLSFFFSSTMLLISTWNSSSQERTTSATMPSSSRSLSTRSSDARMPCWKAPTAPVAALPAALLPLRSLQSFSIAATAAALQLTASMSKSWAACASLSDVSKTRPTILSACCTSIFGGLRATTASIGTQRWSKDAQRTLVGLPLQESEPTGNRS
mmetsp:Transcript_66658/g.171605  ORF Transcript_66658/g.171605 Transcript_66658/m.171605 type:complete len:220 (+) Transcript_66658:263-922(+)